MKSLTDAVKLRDHLIAVLEETDTKCAGGDRRKLLSVIVAGAGFAGVETLASINDFLRRSIQFYRNLSEHDLRLTLNISGFLAWWMWRTIYLSKLPRLEKSFVSPGIGR